MERLEKKLKECMNEQLVRIIISNRRKSMDITKVQVQPIQNKEQLAFQFSFYVGKQVKHSNLKKEDAINEILTLLKEQFKQFEMETENYIINGLVSKKGMVTLKEKAQVRKIKADLSHNRQKKYLLDGTTVVPFLVDLGVQTAEGKIVDKKYNKFKQINRFLEFIKDILPALDKNRQLTIIDFGCGKSYLTFAMYYYLKILNHYNVKMIGLDLKEDVINHCNELRTKYGYTDLDFFVGDISTYEGVSKVDMVVTLHACDTATDYALAKAVEWNADVILSVPCCQHEVNAQIQSERLQSMLKYGIIKERFSALFTDAIRANLLEEQGYETQILEFVDMSHTPKNLLIRAVKTSQAKGDYKKREQLEKELAVKLTMEGLLSKDLS